MRRIKRLVVVGSMVWVSILAAAPPASSVVCHEEPGSCCKDVEILGKPILHIDC